jgi:secondary thiamine-phosphate synthase enzyme
VAPMWNQRQIRLGARPRGFHLVTREITAALPELGAVRVGLAHLHLLHTSASLTLNENASPDVRRDFESWFDRAVPEDARYWTHNDEGPDDMPAHIKASLLGASLTLPVRDGRLALGTWQGVYLCEHRDDGGARSLLVTLWGED